MLQSQGICLEGRLGGGLAGHRLEPVDEIGGPLRVGSRREDGAIIVLQDFQPVGDVGAMVLAGLQHDAEIGAQERRAQ